MREDLFDDVALGGLNEADDLEAVAASGADEWIDLPDLALTGCGDVICQLPKAVRAHPSLCSGGFDWGFSLLENVCRGIICQLKEPPHRRPGRAVCFAGPSLCWVKFR